MQIYQSNYMTVMAQSTVLTFYRRLMCRRAPSIKELERLGA